MTLLAVLFAVAAGVWMIPLVTGGRVIAMAILVLLVGTVFGPFFFNWDGLIQLSFDRLMLPILLVMLAVRWRTGQLKLTQPNRIDWTMFALSAWLLVSMLRTYHSGAGTMPIGSWFFYIAIPAAMYALTRCVDLPAKDIKLFVNAILGISLYLAVTAVLEVSGAHALVFPSYIADASHWEFLGRGRGPLLNPAANGLLLTIGLMAAIVGFLNAQQKAKLGYLLAAIVISAGILATLTRSVWLGALAAVAIVAIVHAPRWVRIGGLAAVVLLSGAMALGLKDEFVRLKRDKNLTASDAEKSIQLRPLLAVVAWEMFKDRPLDGHGFGYYRRTAKRFHENRSYGLPLDMARPYIQHNAFLSVVAESGLVGLALYLALLIGAGGIAWRLARDRSQSDEARWLGLILLGTLVAYVCNGMFHNTLIIPMVHMYLFFLLGLTITAAAKGVQPKLNARAIDVPMPADRRLVTQ